VTSATTLPALAAGASVESATGAQKKQAAKAYASGMKQFEKKNFEDALTEFERSYDIVKSPNSSLMIGRALAELGRYGQAWDVFKETEREAQAAARSDAKYKKTQEAAQAEIRDLSRKAAFVSISVSDAGEDDHVVVEGQALKIEELAEPKAVTPGTVRISLTGPSGKEISFKEVNVEAGETVEVQLAPESAAAEPISDDDARLAEDDEPAKQVEVSTSGSSKRTLAYVATGLGVAGLATFGVFGFLNNSKFGDLEEACPDRRCPPDREEDADAGRMYQTIANVGLVVGVVGVGAGVTLFLLSGSSDEQSPAEARVRVGPGNVSLSGRF
jgi:hypothetical protein